MVMSKFGYKGSSCILLLKMEIVLKFLEDFTEILFNDNFQYQFIIGLPANRCNQYIDHFLTMLKSFEIIDNK
jgi:hypothetical protein